MQYHDQYSDDTSPVGGWYGENYDGIRRDYNDQLNELYKLRVVADTPPEYIKNHEAFLKGYGSFDQDNDVERKKFHSKQVNKVGFYIVYGIVVLLVVLIIAGTTDSFGSWMAKAAIGVTCIMIAICGIWAVLEWKYPPFDKEVMRLKEEEAAPKYFQSGKGLTAYGEAEARRQGVKLY